MRTFGLAMVGVCALWAGPARGDQWDYLRGDDTSGTTRNELVHGSEQLHDLANHNGTSGIEDDKDWYLIAQQPYASYEIVVDSTSAVLGGVLEIDRLDGGGAVLQTSASVGAGFSRSLRWQNAGLVGSGQKARVRPTPSACNQSCTTDDVYRLRFYETSYGIARFNNTGTQTTVIQIQNPAAYPIAGFLYFWSGTGTLLATQSFSLPPKQLLTLSTPTVNGVAGQSGSITVTHDGRYGDLVGKAVAMETGTGFTFDTLMVSRPR